MLEIRAPKPGEKITSAFLTQLAALVMRRIIGGVGIDVKHTGTGTIVSLNTTNAVPGQSPPRWQRYTGE